MSKKVGTEVRLTRASWKDAAHPPCDSPSTSRRFALGASNACLVVKTQRAPSRLSRDTRVYGHTTTAMHKPSTPPPSSHPPFPSPFSSPPPRPLYNSLVYTSSRFRQRKKFPSPPAALPLSTTLFEASRSELFPLRTSTILPCREEPSPRISPPSSLLPSPSLQLPTSHPSSQLRVQKFCPSAFPLCPGGRKFHLGRRKDNPASP